MGENKHRSLERCGDMHASTLDSRPLAATLRRNLSAKSSSISTPDMVGSKRGSGFRARRYGAGDERAREDLVVECAIPAERVPCPISCHRNTEAPAVRPHTLMLDGLDARRLPGMYVVFSTLEDVTSAKAGIFRRRSGAGTGGRLLPPFSTFP